MSEPIRKVLTAVRAESPFPKDFYRVFHATGIPPWWPLKGITWIGFASQSQRLHSSFTLWCKLARYKHHCCLVDFYFWGRLSPTATEDKEEFLIIIKKSLMWTWPVSQCDHQRQIRWKLYAQKHKYHHLFLSYRRHGWTLGFSSQG